MGGESTPVGGSIAPGAAEASAWLDIQGLGTLKAGANEQRPDTVRKVAQQFESLFLGMMLKSMRDAKLAESPFDSDESRLYQDMFDKQVSLTLSQGKGLGIAEMLVRQLQPETRGILSRETAQAVAAAGARAAAADGDANAEPSAPRAAPGTVPDGGTCRPQDRFADTPEEFVRKVLPHAQAAAAELGVPPAAIVAQAALETGWGRNVPAAPSGAGHNLFGIKAGADWTGARLGRPTVEVENGTVVRRHAAFRAYDSVADGFRDYVQLLQTSRRYSAARNAGADPARFAHGLQAGGYATDPNYARKILQILNGDTLRDALAAAGATGHGTLLALKTDGPRPMT